MKTIFPILLLLLLSMGLNAQNTKLIQAIETEGKLLYRLEKAAWLGTDIFLEQTTSNTSIGAYLTYPVGNSTQCVFINNQENPKVIGTLTFDHQFDLSNVLIQLDERDLTQLEKDLLTIRTNTLAAFSTSSIFSFYKNTGTNIIPIIRGKEKKVYVLTAPKENNLLLLGNDYLIDFKANNQIKKIEKLHNSLIQFTVNNENETLAETMHNHVTGKSEYITATDICTLMLYADYFNINRHIVVSKKYYSFWDCKTHQLTVIPSSTIKKINAHQNTISR